MSQLTGGPTIPLTHRRHDYTLKTIHWPFLCQQATVSPRSNHKNFDCINFKILYSTGYCHQPCSPLFPCERIHYLLILNTSNALVPTGVPDRHSPSPHQFIGLELGNMKVCSYFSGLLPSRMESWFPLPLAVATIKVRPTTYYLKLTSATAVSKPTVICYRGSGSSDLSPRPQWPRFRSIICTYYRLNARHSCKVKPLRHALALKLLQLSP